MGVSKDDTLNILKDKTMGHWPRRPGQVIMDILNGRKDPSG